MTSTLSPTVHSPVINSDDLDLELEKLDPKSLVIGTNVRIDQRLDEELIASIRARGVRTPIAAYRDGQGRVVVLRGQRRTLIAVMAGRPLVPVVIEPEPSDSDRVIDQLGENDHRAGLSTNEHVAAYEQLAAYGLSADEISAMTATSKDRVEAGLRVAASKVARGVVQARPGVDLFHAAAFQEFEDDPEIVAKLTRTIELGQGFDHWARHHRDQRQEASEKAEAEEQARQEGFAVVTGLPAYDDPKTRRIEYLKQGRKNMTSELHAECPGRAVTVHWSYKLVGEERTRVWLRTEWCLDFGKHGHKLQDGQRAGAAKADLTPQEKAEATAERRRVIKFNGQWRSATTLRHEFLQAVIERKKLPEGAGKIMAAVFTADRLKLSWSLQRGSHHAHKLFGLTKPEYNAAEGLKDVADGANENRAQLIALAMALAAYEDNIDETAWRHVDGGSRRYLRFLECCGYELSDVERIAAGLALVVDVEAAQAAGDAQVTA